MIGVFPNKPIVSWKYPKLKMYLPTRHHSLAQPALNVLRTLILAYSWVKSSDMKPIFILKCWIFHVTYWIRTDGENNGCMGTGWASVYLLFTLVVTWLTGSCGSLPPSSITREDNRKWNHLYKEWLGSLSQKVFQVNQLLFIFNMGRASSHFNGWGAANQTVVISAIPSSTDTDRILQIS